MRRKSYDEVSRGKAMSKGQQDYRFWRYGRARESNSMYAPISTYPKGELSLCISKTGREWRGFIVGSTLYDANGHEARKGCDEKNC